MESDVPEPSERVQLHYVETLTGFLRDTVGSSNFSLLLLSFIGLLLLAISFGAVSVGHSVDLLGLELQLPSWVFYIGGSWIVGALWMYAFALELHGRMLAYKILRSYEQLGFEEPKWDAKWKQLLTGPGFFSITFSKSRFRHTVVSKFTQFTSAILVLLAITLFPLFTQIVATVRVVSEYGPTWWVILVQSLIILVSLGYAITALGKIKEQNRRWSHYFKWKLTPSEPQKSSVST